MCVDCVRRINRSEYCSFDVRSNHGMRLKTKAMRLGNKTEAGFCFFVEAHVTETHVNLQIRPNDSHPGLGEKPGFETSGQHNKQIHPSLDLQI